VDDTQAKRLLADMLESFTAGSVLHLLGEVLLEGAEQDAEGEGDPDLERAREVEAALYVVGLGVDSVCPGQ
jgi:hypothetical protein